MYVCTGLFSYGQKNPPKWVRQTLRLQELSLKDVEFPSVSYLMACAQIFDFWFRPQFLHCRPSKLLQTATSAVRSFCRCNPWPLYLRTLWRYTNTVIITALHAMQTQSSDENSVRLSVCLSVCLSVTRVHCDKTVERSVQIYIPYERTFIPLFWEEEWLVG